jgi:hypothetical protein
MAIIALQNSPSWNYHLSLNQRPKRKAPQHKLGRSHTPRERRRRKPAMPREFKATLAEMTGRALWARPESRHYRTGRWIELGEITSILA